LKGKKKMENFKQIAKILNLEVHIMTDEKTEFGLQWGEGKRGQLLGISRKRQIEALNWADKNPAKAIKIAINE
jgi:hypothetical protein